MKFQTILYSIIMGIFLLYVGYGKAEGSSLNPFSLFFEAAHAEEVTGQAPSWLGRLDKYLDRYTLSFNPIKWPMHGITWVSKNWKQNPWKVVFIGGISIWLGYEAYKRVVKFYNKQAEYRENILKAIELDCAAYGRLMRSNVQNAMAFSHLGNNHRQSVESKLGKCKTSFIFGDTLLKYAIDDLYASTNETDVKDNKEKVVRVLLGSFR